jgi:DNA-binding transcriptional regulator YhcF (GntR family)
MVYTNTFLVQGETMIPEFHVDKVGDTPVYRQVAEKIIELIGSGELKNGERLPPEREMAERLAVARGTIKKAYEELALRRVVVPARGAALYRRRRDSPRSGRLDKPGASSTLFSRTSRELRFSPQEIGNLIHLKISERRKKGRDLHRRCGL